LAAVNTSSEINQLIIIFEFTMKQKSNHINIS